MFRSIPRRASLSKRPHTFIPFAAAVLGFGYCAVLDAAPPTSPANPFNVAVTRNAVVSPADSTPAEIRREHKISELHNIETLVTQNLTVVSDQITSVLQKISDLKSQLDDLENSGGSDSAINRLKKRIKRLRNELGQFYDVQAVYAADFVSLDSQIDSLEP